MSADETPIARVQVAGYKPPDYNPQITGRRLQAAEYRPQSTGQRGAGSDKRWQTGLAVGWQFFR